MELDRFESEDHFRCQLCGYDMGMGDRPWLHQLRAVVAHYPRLDEPCLSGIGYYGRYNVFYPQDPSQSILDADEIAKFEDEDPYPVFRLSAISRPFSRGTIREDDYTGVQMHNSCWELLMRMCPHLEIRKFLDIARSFPQGNRLIDWGHGYGGDLSFEHDPRHWVLRDGDVFGTDEQRQERMDQERGRERWDSYSLSTAFDDQKLQRKSDPFNIPCIKEHIIYHDPAVVDQPLGIAPLPQMYREMDPFSKLPTELLSSIMHYLPTSAVASCRSASRVFASLALSQSFWASRFHEGHECEHIFEVWDYAKGKALNWRKIYSAISLHLKDPALKARRRLWSLLKPIVLLLQAFSNVKIQGEIQDEDVQPGTRMRFVNGDYCEDNFGPPGRVSSPAKTLYTRVIQLPKFWKTIGVSIIKYMGVTFITGLQVGGLDGSFTSLGYILRRPHVSYWLADPLKPSSMVGFDVAIEPRGFRALALYRRIDLPWAGFGDGSSMARLMSEDRHMSALIGKFDGFKMTGLGCPIPTKDMLLRYRRLWQYLWTPSIPSGVHFNAHTFLNQPIRSSEDKYHWKISGADTGKQTYIPIHYTIFGGFGGQWLKHLNRVSVWFMGDQYDRIPMGVVFRYNIPINGSYSMILGQEGPFSVAEYADAQRYEQADFHEDKVIHFDINGLDGEYISRVFLIKSVHTAFRVVTNWGRACDFGPERSTREEDLQPIEYRKGTRILGFYSFITYKITDELEFGMARLGIMSQDISRLDDKPAVPGKQLTRNSL